MPVGCLGDAGRSAANGGSSLYLSNNKGAAENGGGRGTAESASRQAERFALMQETLLMQIFRCDRAAQQDGGGGNNRSQDGGGGHNRSQDEAGDCPNCTAFSDQCCQHDTGIRIFQEFQETNWQCFWNAPLVKAVSSLRFQVCLCLIFILSQCGRIP